MKEGSGKQTSGDPAVQTLYSIVLCVPATEGYLLAETLQRIEKNNSWNRVEG